MKENLKKAKNIIKKVFGVLLIIIFIGAFYQEFIVQDNPNKDSNKISPEQITSENKETNKKEKSSSKKEKETNKKEDNTSISFNGEVDDFLRNYKRISGNIIVGGLWGTDNDNNKVVMSVDPNSTNNAKLNIPDLDTSTISDFARVFVYGKANGNSIDVEDIQYINPMSEPYWGNSTLINNPNNIYEQLLSYEPYQDEEYEMSIVATGPHIGRIIGTDYSIYMDNIYSMVTGSSYHILVNNVSFNDIYGYFEGYNLEILELK